MTELYQILVGTLIVVLPVLTFIVAANHRPMSKEDRKQLTAILRERRLKELEDQRQRVQKLFDDGLPVFGDTHRLVDALKPETLSCIERDSVDYYDRCIL